MVPDADADILDRLLDHLRASTEAQVCNAERLEALTLVTTKVHEDLATRNALETQRQTQAASLWTRAGSKPALTVYAAAIYVVLAATGVDPGPLIRALVGTEHVSHAHEAATPQDADEKGVK